MFLPPKGTVRHQARLSLQPLVESINDTEPDGKLRLCFTFKMLVRMTKFLHHCNAKQLEATIQKFALQLQSLLYRAEFYCRIPLASRCAALIVSEQERSRAHSFVGENYKSMLRKPRSWVGLLSWCQMGWHSFSILCELCGLCENSSSRMTNNQSPTISNKISHQAHKDHKDHKGYAS